jgi:hypothetical protein
LIGYAATLSDELLPRRVPAVFCVRGSDQVVMPPCRWDGANLLADKTCGLADFVADEDATLLDVRVAAAPGRILWIDRERQSHYEPAADARAHLIALAIEHTRSAKQALKDGNWEAALHEAQAAISADGQCLDALLTKALVYRAQGDWARASVLIDIAQSVDPHCDIEGWLGLCSVPFRTDPQEPSAENKLSAIAVLERAA